MKYLKTGTLVFMIYNFQIGTLYGAEILNPGESITISCGSISNNADSYPHRSKCNRKDMDCAKATEALLTKFKFCNASMSGGSCAKSLWPKFTQSYPSCEKDGVKICLEYCNQSISGGTCATEICN